MSVIDGGMAIVAKKPPTCLVLESMGCSKPHLRGRGRRVVVAGTEIRCSVWRRARRNPAAPQMEAKAGATSSPFVSADWPRPHTSPSNVQARTRPRRSPAGSKSLDQNRTATHPPGQKSPYLNTGRMQTSLFCGKSGPAVKRLTTTTVMSIDMIPLSPHHISTRPANAGAVLQCQ